MSREAYIQSLNSSTRRSIGGAAIGGKRHRWRGGTVEERKERQKWRHRESVVLLLEGETDSRGDEDA